MTRFTIADRDRVRESVLARARADDRISGGALVGSSAFGAMDEHSDLDITFGVRKSATPSRILDDYTHWLDDEVGIADHFDVCRGNLIYRVILFTNGLELDLSVAPEDEFGQLGPDFRLLFGDAVMRGELPLPHARDAIGWGWHHALHAHAAIGRERRWQAVFWINSLRDKTLTMMLLRLQLPHAEARGAHSLPHASADALEATLIRSTDEAELRRALSALTSIYIGELALHDRELSINVGQVLTSVIIPALQA